MLGRKGEKANGKTAEQGDTAQNGGNPLFYKKPAPLTLERHQKAGIVPNIDLSFAKHTNSVSVNAVEFMELAKYYPIVFTVGENPLPVVVLGLEKDNYFIGDDKQWKADNYIPAYIRKYPFAFMEVPEKKQFILCVDEESVFYQDKAGKDAQPFYNGEDPSAMTKNALEFCTAFHNHYQITRHFMAGLVEHDLLVMNQSEAVLNNGRKIRLGGFQLIDEKKLGELPNEVFLEFRKKGWLPYIYFALMSGSNWKRLADIASALDAKKAA